MTFFLLVALQIALYALLRVRKLEKKLADTEQDFQVLLAASTKDFQQTMRLAQQHDRLLGEKNNLLAANDSLRAELRRKHRRTRIVL